MKKIFSSIQEDLSCCYVTENTRVAIHHVFPGTSRRKMCEVYGFIVALVPELHNLGNDSVHSKPNQGLDLELKQTCQRYFEIHFGTRKDFILHFGKSYL